MSITLEKVDQVRERTGVSYQKAKEVLEQTEGDVLEAIVLIEQEPSAAGEFAQNASDFGNEVIKTLKDLLKSGNVTRIVVEKEERIVMDIPVTVGALGALFLTSATVVALVATLATGCIIKIHKEDGEEINVNERASEMMKEAKDKAQKVYEKTKQHVTEPHVVREETEEEVEETEAEEPKVTINVEEEDDQIKVEVVEE